jgi:hypothetical protein
MGFRERCKNALKCLFSLRRDEEGPVVASKPNMVTKVAFTVADQRMDETKRASVVSQLGLPIIPVELCLAKMSILNHPGWRLGGSKPRHLVCGKKDEAQRKSAVVPLPL